MKKTISEISFILHENQNSRNYSSLICGVSGGQDSIFLVIFLLHLKILYQIKIQIVYCNHFWQKENIYTISHITKLAYIFNLPINIIVSKKPIISETQGHDWRQNCFFQIGNYLNTKTIFIGHTATDQIETALLNFLRGTSPKGIGSLKSKKIFQSNLKSNQLFPFDFYQNKTRNSYLKFESKTNFFKSKSKRFLVMTSIRKLTKNLIYQKYSKKVNELNQNSMRTQLDFNVQNTEKNFFSLQNFSTPELHLSYFYNWTSKSLQLYKMERPLLNISRSQIKKLILKNKFPIFYDNTNKELDIFRNKIRLVIFPVLRFSFQQKSNFQIRKFLSILELEQNYLDILCQEIIGLYFFNPQYITTLNFIPPPIQQSILQKLLQAYSLKLIKQNYINQIF